MGNYCECVLKIGGIHLKTKEFWYDIRGFSELEVQEILPVVFTSNYTGIMLQQWTDILKWPKRIKILFMLTEDNLDDAKKMIDECGNNKDIIIFSEKEELLKNINDAVDKGVYGVVNDKKSMEEIINLSARYKNIIVEFEGDTNIPLELILSYSQINNSKICKLVNCSTEGWTAAMIMEMGSHSVLIKTKDINEIIGVEEKFNKFNEDDLDIEPLIVKEVIHLSMGDRVCIDTTSRLDMNEGILIGSTSNGGILISSETHFLPYMDLRPFRVNAGALHSYVWCVDGKTKYLSELKAGDEVLAVNSEGHTRIVNVGRVKIERRPMLLVKAESKAGIELNVIVQDDWHIRIISPDGSVKNSTLLKNGDVIAGYTCTPGRHLGVKIDESIVEK